MADNIPFKGTQEQLIDLISCYIYLIGDTECVKTCELELIGICGHERDSVDADFLIVVGLNVTGLHLIDALSGSLILKNLAQEQTNYRVDDYEVVDRVRQKGFVKSCSVRHKIEVLDLCNAVTSVYLGYLADIKILGILSCIKSFNVHVKPPEL